MFNVHVARLEQFFLERPLRILLSVPVVAILVFHLYMLLKFEAFNFVEFEMASFAMLLGRQTMPYQDLTREIVPVGYYGPAFYSILAWAGSIFDMLKAPHSFLVLCRILTFMHFAGAMYLFFRLAKALSTHTSAALLLTAVVFNPYWMVLGLRPDAFALFYTLLALVLLAEQPQAKIGVCILASAAMGLAFLYLQRYLCLMVAWSVTRHPKVALDNSYGVSSRITTVVVGGLYLAVDSQGPEVLTHSFLVPYMVSMPDQTLVEVLRKMGPQFIVLVVCGVFFMFLASEDEYDAGGQITRLYALVSFFFAIIVIHSRGAAPKVLLEAVLSFSLLIACGLGQLRLGAEGGTSKGWLARRQFVGLFVMFLLIYPLTGFGYVLQQVGTDVIGSRAEYDPTIGFEDEIEQLPNGPILCDDTIIAYRKMRPESSIEPYYYANFFVPRGMFDLEPTKKRIRESYYAFISLRRNSHFSRLFQKEIGANYRVYQQIGIYTIWVPKNSSPS